MSGPRPVPGQSDSTSAETEPVTIVEQPIQPATVRAVEAAPNGKQRGGKRGNNNVNAEKGAETQEKRPAKVGRKKRSDVDGEEGAGAKQRSRPCVDESTVRGPEDLLMQYSSTGRVVTAEDDGFDDAL